MEIVIYLLVILWIFPAVKHFNRRFGQYFLILALIDPIALVNFFVFDVHVALIKIPANLVLLSVFFPQNISERYKIYYFVFVVIVSIIGYHLGYIFEITFIIHGIIFIYLVNDVFREYIHGEVLNLLVLMIAFYELSALFKHFSQLLGIEKSYYYFHITSIFQILFGVFFSLVGEWKIRIKSTIRNDKV
jgi:hypothetical protein